MTRFGCKERPIPSGVVIQHCQRGAHRQEASEERSAEGSRWRCSIQLWLYFGATSTNADANKQSHPSRILQPCAELGWAEPRASLFILPVPGPSSKRLHQLTPV